MLKKIICNLLYLLSGLEYNMSGEKMIATLSNK